MNQQSEDMRQFLSTEQARRMAELGSMPDQNAILEEQIAQAQALRNRPAAEHTSPIGAAFGGIAGLLDMYTANKQTEAARQQQARNISKADAIRGDTEAEVQAIIQELRRGRGKPESVGPRYAPLVSQQPQDSEFT